MAARLFARPPFDGSLRRAAVRHDRRVSADALGDPRRAARVRHARRGRLPRRTQRHPAVESGGLRGQAGVQSARGHAAARHPRRQPVSRRDAARSSPRWRARCRSASTRRSPSKRRSRTLHKADVIKRGIELGVPLELTLSCMQPKDGLHCGKCSKCRERRDAFHEAGVEDPTAVPAHTDQVTRPDGSKSTKSRTPQTTFSGWRTCGTLVTFAGAWDGSSELAARDASTRLETDRSRRRS